MIGQTLSHHRIIERLGAGGMGEVNPLVIRGRTHREIVVLDLGTE